MRSKTIEILKNALKNKKAVGAFNTSNLEITQGIIWAASELQKPCIIQITKSSIDFAGKKVISELINAVIENDSNHAEIGFHLDHGHTFDDIMEAIEIGVDSVMIDASQKNFKENLEITKKIVDYAHSKNVTVQAELGKVPYIGREEMSEIDWEEIMTNPEEAKQLVEETNIDALAVGIGNAHGFFREKEIPDWERLRKIRYLLPKTPLILHGASDWDNEKVTRATEEGINCFNVDTDIRLAFITAICKKVNHHCAIKDPRELMAEVRMAVKNKVKDKINLFHHL